MYRYHYIKVITINTLRTHDICDSNNKLYFIINLNIIYKY